VKIIYVTASLPHGSDEAFLIPEINQLMRSGHEVLVVPRSPRGSIVHGHELVERTRGEALYSLRVLKAAWAETLAAPGQTAGAVGLLLGGRSPAVAIKNLAIVPKALWLARVAVRWRADHIHCHWAGTTATMAMLASQRSGVPWSFTAHRWDIVENNLLAAKVRSASVVRFISEDGLRMASDLGIGPVKNTRVLHMGVPIPARGARRLGPRPVVLCPARFVEVKGHRYLLEAWRTLQLRGLDAELWLAGQGELRPQLEELTNALGLAGSVRFLGALPHSALLKIYEEGPVSAVVLASLDLGNGLHEGIPVALIEAMSYGIPVVTTATGGTAELVTPETGVLVPSANPAALADAIERLLQDAQLREQLGDSGRRHVAETYDVVRVAAELVNEFEAATQTGRAVLQCAQRVASSFEGF
jgi:colanic acid/amylovoran biosynthesis glycosyltransferase